MLDNKKDEDACEKLSGKRLKRKKKKIENNQKNESLSLLQNYCIALL